MKTLRACILAAMALSQSAAFAQTEALDAQIEAWIANNPEKIIESLQRFEGAKRQADTAKQEEAVRAFMPAVYANQMATEFGAGASFATETMVIFSDYRCPHCNRTNAAVREILAEKEDLRVIILELPVLGEQSVAAARFAIAMRLLHGPDGYHKAHDALFDFGGNYSTEWLEGFASKEGYDTSDITEMAASDRVTEVLEANGHMAAQGQIRGTPYIMIGDLGLPGAIEAGQLRVVLEKLQAED